MGTFLQFDPAKNNMQTHSVYAASSFRAQGAVTGIASSSAFNKLIYQLSTMTTALADMMISKGYAIDDASLDTLTAQLDKIMTLRDMDAYASTASLLDYIKKEAVVIKTTSYIILTTDMYKTLEANSSGTLEANSSGTLTFTLPAYATVANGAWIKIKNVGTDVLTLSGLIDGAASKDLNQYEEITVYSDGISWRGKVIASTSVLSFDASLTENGYQKLPSNKIEQWGHYSSSVSLGSEYTITFPTAFTTACFNAVAITRNDSYVAHQVAMQLKGAPTTTSATFVVVGTSYGEGTPDIRADNGFFWQAIGY